MNVFRISGKKYIKDLSGRGAELNGGRWNRVDVPVLYTGSNHSVAAMEYFVHLKDKIKLKENIFGRITIEVPDVSIKEIRKEDIHGWSYEEEQLYKICEELFSITDDWIAEGKFLCLKVPSIASPGDHNYLINPKHPLATPDNIKIVGDVEDYSYDPRMFGKKLDVERLNPFSELINEALNLLKIKPSKK